MKNKIMIYLWLAWTSLFINSFTFGGGYVAVPMVRKYFVLHKKLFSEEELLEMAAVAQSSPGAVAVNLFCLAGLRAAGLAGFAISGVFAVLPSFIILSAVSLCYDAVVSNHTVTAVLRGMQAGAAALIVDYIADMTAMILKERSRLLNVLAALAFAVGFFTDVSVIPVILGGSAVCILRVRLQRGAAEPRRGVAEPRKGVAENSGRRRH